MKFKALKSMPATFALFFLGGCASQVVNLPINPYVNPEVASRQIENVAVMPFLIPDYLNYGEGGEAVSIDLTNSFIAELASGGVYRLTDGDKIKMVIEKEYANPRDWIFQGNRRDAVRIAQQVGADAVIFGTIKKYFQGNLSDSEFELEIQCIEVASMQTMWSIREVLIGRGGKKYLNETPFSIPPARLGEIATRDAARKVARIKEAGGPINVVAMSYRKAWGYGVLATGLVLSAAGAYYYNEAESAYREYKDAGDDVDQNISRKKTEEYDKAWQLLGGVGVAAVGTGIYLILTDHIALAEEKKEGRRWALSPTLLGPNAPGVACVLRF